MGQITWKTMEAPSLQTPMIAYGAAGTQLNRAMDSLADLARGIRAQNDSNWNVEARNNTENVISSIGNIQNLNDFNEQKSNFDPVALRDTYGEQLNHEAIQNALNARQKELQNNAILNASNNAISAAKQNGSISSAIDTLRQTLQNSGVKDPTVYDAAQNELLNHGLASYQQSQNEAQEAIKTNALSQMLTGAPSSQNTVNQSNIPNYGKRVDGTYKGTGYFGELPMQDGSGRVATEISIGVNINGKETEIPSLVPTLTEDEKTYLLKGGDPNKKPEIIHKAVDYAHKRIDAGLSPFANSGSAPASNGSSPQMNYIPGTTTWNGRGLSPAQYQIESGKQNFRPDGTLVTSGKGAQSAAQVMPNTATDPGFGVRPADPKIMAGNDIQAKASELNRVGNDYMDALRQHYNGNEAKALIAYNWGPGNLDNVNGDITKAPSDVQSYAHNIISANNKNNALQGANSATLVSLLKAKQESQKMQSDDLSNQQKAYTLGQEQINNNKADAINQLTAAIVANRHQSGNLDTLPTGLNYADPNVNAAITNANIITANQSKLSQTQEDNLKLAGTNLQNKLNNIKQLRAVADKAAQDKVDAMAPIMPTDDVLNNVNRTGISAAIADKTYQPGYIKDFLSPYDFHDDVAAGLAKQQNELMKKGASPDMANKILLVAIKMAGAERQNSDGKKSLRLSQITDKIDEARANIDKYNSLVAQRDTSLGQTNKLINDTSNYFTNLLAQTKNKMRVGQFTGNTNAGIDAISSALEQLK